jgi:TetR/AcrR family transcriptional regulator, regulator of cefoperazone and chloramphenicol sensitivity
MTHDTHRQLLDAAVTLFAERGFRKTTVRDICRAADANVSAVKYHFGNKEALYNAAFDHARKRSNETNPFVRMDKARDFHANESPERRLYLFIRTMLDHQFRDGQLTDLTRLMSHEMMHPTPALDRLVDISVKRVYTGLIQIILDLMPHTATGSSKGSDPAAAREQQARQYAMSVSAQCHFHHLALPLIQRLEPSQRHTPEALDTLANHIHRFTLGAIRAS